MKSMVDAFSDYAQPVNSRPKCLDINTLIRDITELHVAHLTKIRFLFDLTDDLPLVMTDPDRGSAGTE